MNGLVVGFEGDGSGASIHGATPQAFFNPAGLIKYCASELDALGTDAWPRRLHI